MKTTVMGFFMAAALMTGCAHQTLAPAGERDVRGSARIGHAARAIVSGPALMVHASGEKPVRWFLVDRVSGGDSDCAAAPSTGSPVSESRAVHLTIAPGHVLCAEVPQGATDVAWHQLGQSTPNMWALR